MSNAKDFKINKAGVLTKYIGKGGDVVIPDGVSSIGDCAFEDCKKLTSVVIPDSVTSIEGGAFQWCENLTSIVIPDSVTSIDGWAFQGCKKLTSIVIPDGVTSIGDCAFAYCKKLTSVVIPEGVTSIGDCAFEDCRNVTSVIIPDSVTSIGDGAFRGCKKLCDANGFFIVRGMLIAYNGPGGDVIIPDGVISIGDGAFWNCRNLTSVVIPDSVTSIGEHVFANCDNLKRITIPTCVGSFLTKAFLAYPRIAFRYRDDMRINIPDLSVLPTKFRPYAALCFVEDGGQPGDPRFENHGKYLQTNAGKLAETAAKNPALLALLCREKWIKAKDVETFLAAVQQTGNAEAIAMVLDYQSNTLTKKEKEKAVKQKEEQKEKQEDTVIDRAMARMNQKGIFGLNFVVSGDLETFENRNELKIYIEQQGGKLQSSMSAKTDYLITNDLRSQTEKKRRAAELGIDILTERQFNDKAGRSFTIDQCGTLTRYIGAGGDVVIPDAVTSIGDGAFRGCKNLTSIVIPDGVTSIGDGAFRGCIKLCDSDGFFIARGVLAVYNGAGGDVIIPDGVTCIGPWTFGGCENLTSIVIPDGVTSIGDYAFYHCKNLANVAIPDSVTSIGNEAFACCENLTSIVLPDGVTSIGNKTFLGCKSLCSTDGFFIVRGDLAVYNGTDGDVVIPEGVTSIGDWVFSNCKNLTSIVIPNSVINIGAYAFRGCNNLTSVTIPDSVTSIGDNAFEWCWHLTVHASAGSYAKAYAKKNKIPFVEL